MLQHPHHGLLEHTPHHSSLQSPAPEPLHQELLAAGTHHKQHALLGFREQVLVGGHALFAGGHTIEIELDAHIPLGGHLRAAAGETGGAHVLRGHHITTLERLETGFNQPLLQERIPHLHGRTVIEGGGAEFSTGKTGSTHAITARGASHVNHWIAHT